MNDFDQGVFYAAAIMVDFIDQPTMAADVLAEAGLLDSDISNLDDTEKNAMIKLSKYDDRCQFKGI